MVQTNIEMKLDGSTFYIPKRYIQSAMLGICILVAFLNRTNMSVAIVSMTDQEISNTNNLVYNWTQQEKGFVLSSFYWGYILTQIPSGILGQHVSPKLILMVTNLISPLIVILIPAASEYGGWQLVCTLRFILGLCQGGIFPIIFILSAKWFPPDERNRLLGLAISGGTLGNIIGLPLCGALAYSAAGWPAMFYVSGLLTVLWALSWIWLGADSPATHSSISKDERELIETSLINSTNYNQKLKTPWKAIFTSVPFWALFVTQILSGFSLSISATETPSFLRGVLKVNIAENGLLSAIPRITGFIFMFPVSWFGDYLIKKNIFSKNVVRKTWTTMYMTIANLVMLTLGLSKQDPLLVMIILTVSSILSSFFCGGAFLNSLDLSPNFAGVINSLTNTAESCMVIVGPLMVGLIVNDAESLFQWWIVYLITAIISSTGNLVFIIFGSTDLQPWNKVE